MNRVGGSLGVRGGNGDGNRVGGRNGDVNSGGDGAGAGTATGVEVNEGEIDGNGDGSRDGAGTGTGTGLETRGRSQDGNGDERTVQQLGGGGGGDVTNLSPLWEKNQGSSRFTFLVLYRWLWFPRTTGTNGSRLWFSHYRGWSTDGSGRTRFAAVRFTVPG